MNLHEIHFFGIFNSHIAVDSPNSQEAKAVIKIKFVIDGIMKNYYFIVKKWKNEENEN